MKKVTLAFILLAACDSRPPEPTGKEEAGQVALGCLDQMGSCEDWTPIDMAKSMKRLEIPTCEEYSYASNCRDQKHEAVLHNLEIDKIPSVRSPCQQKIDACVSLVRVLIAAPDKTEIHHHHSD